MNAGRLRTQAIVAAIAAAGAALALLLALTAPADAKKPEKGPKGPAFYEGSGKLPKAHGKLIWQRKARQLKAGGLVPLKGSRYTKLVLYTSRTPGGKQVADSGSVAVPKGKPPKGGWPLVSWAHGTTGVADVCAPSRNKKGGPIAGYSDFYNPRLTKWLKAGYAVAQTDYQGLGTPGPHGYLIGEAEGRSVLDIARAARKLDARIGKKILIAGHSQGGHAALFAAGLARQWTPDLKLRGTVSYAPASHLAEQADLLPALTTPGGLSQLVAMIVYGALTETPESSAAELLSDEALAFYPLLDSECTTQLDGYNGIAPSEMLRAGAETAPLLATLAAQNPAVKTKAPILLAQGTADNIVFPFTTDLLNGELVDAGNKVSYLVYDGAGHDGVIGAAQDDVMAFFDKRLPGGR